MGITTILQKLLLGKAFTAENGRVTILGKVYITLIESSSFAYTIQKMFETLGDKKAFEIGLKSAEIAAEKFIRALGVKPSLALEKLLPFTDFYGLGKLRVIQKTENSKKVIYLIKVENSPIVEYAKEKFGKSSKVCKVIEANITAALKIVYKKIPMVEETACYTKGAPYCVFRVEIYK
jgi:predicted hydrocarbon binding protein